MISGILILLISGQRNVNNSEQMQYRQITETNESLTQNLVRSNIYLFRSINMILNITAFAVKVAI